MTPSDPRLMGDTIPEVQAYIAQASLGRMTSIILSDMCRYANLGDVKTLVASELSLRETIDDLQHEDEAEIRTRQ